jgi:hypothetical protein
MAADIRVPGVETADLRDLARSLGATGVGYYPTVQFVHVDVRGTPYFWTDTSGHGDHSHSDGLTADTNESSEPMVAEGLPPSVPSGAQPELSAEVAAILRPPGIDTSANVAPVAPLVVPTAAPMTVPASAQAAPRAKTAPGDVEPVNMPAKLRSAPADEGRLTK